MKSVEQSPGDGQGKSRMSILIVTAGGRSCLKPLQQSWILNRCTRCVCRKSTETMSCESSRPSNHQERQKQSSSTHHEYPDWNQSMTTQLNAKGARRRLPSFDDVGAAASFDEFGGPAKGSHALA